MPSTYILYTALALSFVTAEVYSASSAASVFRITPKKDEDIQVLYSLDRDVDGVRQKRRISLSNKLYYENINEIVLSNRLYFGRIHRV